MAIASDTASAKPWFSGSIVSLLKTAFWFGIVLGIIGSAVSFYPGSAMPWFAVTSILIACGLFVPGKKYKIAGLLLCAGSAVLSYYDHAQGIAYQEWLSTQQLQRPAR